MFDEPNAPRRRALLQMGAGAGGLLWAAGAWAADAVQPPRPVDLGHVVDGPVAFDPWRAPADTSSGPPPAPMPPDRRVGFAVVGLGRLALEQILPADAVSMKARPVALVSGTPDKLHAAASQYGIAPAA